MNKVEVGDTFNRLMLLERTERGKSPRAVFLCNCGKLKEIFVQPVLQGTIKSCGCLRSGYMSQKQATHRMTNTPEYRSWRSMLNRCLNPKVSSYPRYGGRGIQVCERWRKFEAFHADMGKRPEGTTVNRIDNDGNYEPGNCDWATTAEQVRNKSKVSVYKGQTYAEWRRKLGMPATTFYRRVRSRGIEALVGHIA